MDVKKLKRHIKKGDKVLMILVVCAVALITPFLVNITSTNPYYVFDQEVGEIKQEGKYSVKGSMTVLKVGNLNIGEEEVIHVDTSKGSYKASYYKGHIYYIGQPPTEDNPLYGITKEEVKETVLSKEDFKLEGEVYRYYIEHQDSFIGGVDVVNEKSEKQNINIKDGKVVVEIDKEQLSESKSYKLKIWERVAIR